MKAILKKLVIVMFCFTLVTAPCGCASLKTTWNTTVETVKNIDWDEALSYYQKFVSGLKTTLKFVEALFPNTKEVIETTVAPLVDKADTVVTSLATVAAAAKAGTATEAQVTTALTEVHDQVVAANDIVGQLVDTVRGTSTAPTTIAASATN